MLEKSLSNKYLIFLSRVVVGFILIVASIPKIADPESFAKIIQAYQLLPYFSLNIFAVVLPWMELLAGLFLIFGIMLRGSALLSTILFGIFSIIIAISLFRGLTIDCGCFGADSSPLSWQRFFEDIGLLLLSVHVLYFSKLEFSQKVSKT